MQVDSIVRARPFWPRQGLDLREDVASVQIALPYIVFLKLLVNLETSLAYS